MKHLLQKIKLIICGAGGKGGGQQPPPPNVSQYPAVLAPPQFSNLDSISSFSYGEMIDLLSDGPIEGLVNNNRRKVYDENIFEGIYLNDTPIKETSSVSSYSVDITFLKEKLKNHFLKNNRKFTEENINLSTISASLIQDKNFNSDITIKSFAPSISVREFVKSLNGSFDSIPLIEKTFSSSPILGENPFLTIITIPRFLASLPQNNFNVDQGGVDGSYPLKLDMSNISNYIYFSISGENLNSFNYFELPRSFILNNIFTAAGKRTIKNNLLSQNSTTLKYEFLDIKIYIWSLYSNDTGYKNIDSILDKYFNNIKVNQNTQSLFNYNLVQSEFKNGLEYQAPLQYFNNVQIDTEYNKELIGPYKICGSYNPTNAFSNGGIQRVSKFSRVNEYTLPATNTTIENETSDDIRYVKSWPIEYDIKNTPYVICDAVLNYSQFDRSSSSRVSQEAVAVTHYIENENVEEAFITLNVNQLFDTNHIDLTADNSSVLGAKTQSKKNQTDLAPDGINTYSDVVGYKNPIGYTSGNLYLLIYGSDWNDGYVIDGYKTTGTERTEYETGIIYNLNRLNKDLSNTLYYNAIDAFNGLAKCVPSLSTLIGKNLYNASLENCLLYYQIPNDSYLTRESFNIKGYSENNLESKLKLTTIDNNSFYYFGLNQNEQLLKLEAYTPSASLSTILNNYTTNGSKFFVAKAPYRTASTSELTNRNVIAHIINSYIDWDKIITGSSLSIFMQANASRYLNIAKYIANPYLYLNQSKYRLDQTKWDKNIIGNIYLIGLNGNYLRSNYGSSGVLTYLSLDILEQLLEEYALKTDQSTDFKFSLSYSNVFNSNFSTLRAFENILSKFLNGKLMGSSSIFNLKPYSLSQYIIPADANAIKLVDFTFSQYNLSNIFLIDGSKNTIDSQEDKTNGKDVIFEYNLYSNVAQTSILTPVSNAKYVDFNYASDGSQVPDAKSEFVTNGGKMIQQISAGTRLPTIVTIDVETGYEKRENESYIQLSEFYCYRYNIYGIATDQALIDVGRKSQPFLISCKLDSITDGGYANNYKNIYYRDNNLYLIETVCCAGNGLTSTTGYYLTNDKSKYNIAALNNTSLEVSSAPQGFTFFYIYQNSQLLGLCQCNPISSIEEGNYQEIVFSNFDNFSKNLSEKITIADINRFFSNEKKDFNIFSATDFLKEKKYIAEYLSPVEDNIKSYSVSAYNSFNIDRYMYENYGKFAQTTIYNFSFDLYRKVNTDLQQDFEYQSQDFYGQFIKINMPLFIAFGNFYSSVAMFDEFISKFTVDLTSQFPASIFKIQRSTDLNSSIDIFILHKINLNYSDIVSFIKDLILKFINNLAVAGVTSTLNTYPILDMNIYNEGNQLSSSFISNLNNLLSSNGYFVWPEIGNLNSTISEFLEINYSDFIKNIPLNFKYLQKIVRTVDPYKASSLLNPILLYSTDLFNIKSSDVRLNKILNENSQTVNAKFWTIFNYKTNELSIAVNCSDRLNNYEELGCEFNYLNLNCILMEQNKNTKTNLLTPYFPYYGIRLESYTFNALVKLKTYDDPLYITHLQTQTGFDNKTYFVGSAYGRVAVSNGIGINRNNNFFQKATKKTPVDFVTACYNNPTDIIVSNGIIANGFISSMRFQPTNSKTILYYDMVQQSKLFNNFNPELNNSRLVCLITIKTDLTKTSTNFLTCIENVLLQKGLMGSDYRFTASYNTAPIYQKDYLSSNLIISYYELNVSNASSYQTNTLSSDTGLVIQIPKSKRDRNGNIMRRYIKIIKKSHETLSPLISKKISLQKVTEIIPQKFSYPFSAIVGTKIDSRAFSQIPARTFHCKLKKVLIPSNYFIYDENEEDIRYQLSKRESVKIYDGDWDGTFKLGWTNNPAWIMLDLLINKRYGLGNYIESEQVDIWELYKISRWCDCVKDDGTYVGVDDLYGGVEPRHTFNAIINDKFNIFDLINQIASVFRGTVYYLNSLITFDDDRIKPITGEFNNLDVKDGIFSYANHKKDDEYTAADVAYIDSRDSYKPKIEYVEDQEGIRQRGVLKKQINAFGVTSKAQARRFGLYFLHQTSKYNSNVTFTTDNKILLYRPGDLIRINDELTSSTKSFGRVLDIQDINSECFQVLIDQAVNSEIILTKNSESFTKLIYSLDSVTLYTAIAKPKYEDFYSKAQSVPCHVNVFINSAFGLGGFAELKSGEVGNYNGFYRKILSGGSLYSGLQFNLDPFDTTNSAKAFSGSVDVNYAIEKLTGLNGTAYASTNVNYNTPDFIDWTQQSILPQNKFTINEKLTAYLCHVEYLDVENTPSRYGHWEFMIGNDEVPNFKIKLDISNIEGDLSSKYYYFNCVNTGKLLALSGINNLGLPEYIDALNFTNTNLTLNNNLIDCYGVAHASSANGLSYLTYGPHVKYSFYTGGYWAYPASCLYSSNPSITNKFTFDICTFEYKNCTISYQDLIESNRPSIDSFEIDTFSYVDIGNGLSGTNLVLSKFKNGVKKSTVANDLNCLTVGSSYSLNINNYTEKIYKIMSITENYINEYNVIATEFSLDKFKEIEDNYEVDNLKSTFNTLTAYEEALRIESAEKLKAPIILSIDHFIDASKNRYIIIKWDNTQNASTYLIYLQTPSRQTSDFVIESIGLEDFKTSENCFIKTIIIPNSEVGLFTIMIQSRKGDFISTMAKRSINIFNY